MDRAVSRGGSRIAVRTRTTNTRCHSATVLGISNHLEARRRAAGRWRQVGATDRRRQGILRRRARSHTGPAVSSWSTRGRHLLLPISWGAAREDLLHYRQAFPPADRRRPVDGRSTHLGAPALSAASEHVSRETSS